MGRDFACQDSPQESLKTFHFRVRTSLKSPKSELFGSTRLRASECPSEPISRPASAGRYDTPNLPINIVGFRGFDSSIILIERIGIPRPIGNFPEGSSQAMLAGIMLVGRLGVHPGRRLRGDNKTPLQRREACVGCGRAELRPVHLLRVFLLRVLESNFPGDSL